MNPLYNKQIFLSTLYGSHIKGVRPNIKTIYRGLYYCKYHSRFLLTKYRCSEPSELSN